MTVGDPAQAMNVIASGLGAHLRKRGYSGTRPKWQLQDEAGNRLLIAVQQSQSSTARQIRFTSTSVS